MSSSDDYIADEFQDIPSTDEECEVQPMDSAEKIIEVADEPIPENSENEEEIPWHPEIPRDVIDDKSRRPDSNDQGWKYGILVDPKKDKYTVKCLLCGKVSTGGVARLKAHLTGVSMSGKRNVKICPKATSKIYRELMGCMKEKKPYASIFDAPKASKKQKMKKEPKSESPKVLL